MALDLKLLEIVACPICKGKLTYDKSKGELICRLDRVAYPIVDDIPVLLESQARTLSQEELS
ncbi:MAG: Trm112 family protein [Aeromonadaceae bacterium]|nr:Trm112 family protein [Aeromonadaceae bacterium]